MSLSSSEIRALEQLSSGNGKILYDLLCEANYCLFDGEVHRIPKTNDKPYIRFEASEGDLICVVHLLTEDARIQRFVDLFKIDFITI